jgi:hypothetical protein
MTTQNLLFLSSDGTKLFATDGSTIHQLATDTSTPPLVGDPLLGSPISAVVLAGLFSSAQVRLYDSACMGLSALM